MPNGKPGDHPVTDMLVHGMHPFPPDIEAMLREVLRLQPEFPDGKRPFVEGCEWEGRFFAWERGEGLDEGREALRRVLDELRAGDSDGI
jgi:hypothetical protein